MYEDCRSVKWQSIPKQSQTNVPQFLLSIRFFNDTNFFLVWQAPGNGRSAYNIYAYNSILVRGNERKIHLFFFWSREYFSGITFRREKQMRKQIFIFFKSHFYLRDKCEGFPSSLPGTFAVATLYFSYMLSSLLLPSLNVHWSVSKICYYFFLFFKYFFFLNYPVELIYFHHSDIRMVNGTNVVAGEIRGRKTKVGTSSRHT